jgi:hypothetical protein
MGACTSVGRQAPTCIFGQVLINTKGGVNMKRRLKGNLTKQDVYGLFKQAGEYKGKNADGTIVRMIFQIAFFCGLKTGELLSLKGGDAFDDNGAVCAHIIVNGREIAISPTMKTYLEAYWTYLRKKGYPTNRTACLFPIKKRDNEKDHSLAARKRKWHRDIADVAGISNAVGKIRQAGIREYFDQTTSTSKREERLKATADFAGCSEEWVEIVLASGKQEPTSVETNRDDKQFLELRRRVDELGDLQVSESELRELAVEIMRKARTTLKEPSWRNIEYKVKNVLASKGVKV